MLPHLDTCVLQHYSSKFKKDLMYCYVHQGIINGNDPIPHNGCTYCS